MSPYHILIVEDDPDINGLLEKLLTRAGYHARPAFSGSEGKMCLEQYQYDLVLLDLMLPGVTGEELVAQIRRSSTVPIIIISAKASVADRIDLLKLGADDFICKPFDVGEVLARVEAQLRRAVAFSEAGRSPDLLTKGDLVLDAESMEVRLKNQPVSLTLREFKILHLLMSHPKKVFTRENLFTQVWEDEFLGEDNTVNVHISNIRSKLAKIDPDTSYIKTVWGIGFKLEG
ncbi:response regulator transcription factor [Eubacterium maltosivorans]|uniref:response regulator transcription factor n=1 Tax=Eubacterium maltosivorans TaxID=2041044 RepID=UPI000735683C|nr:response regulator transcription factor [Eubacterium maltosivorans]ALU15303.1 two component system response regulator [Eubacterium limosum]